MFFKRKKVAIRLSNQENPFLINSEKKSDFPFLHLLIILGLAIILYFLYNFNEKSVDTEQHNGSLTNSKEKVINNENLLHNTEEKKYDITNNKHDTLNEIEETKKTIDLDELEKEKNKNDISKNTQLDNISLNKNNEENEELNKMKEITKPINLENVETNKTEDFDFSRKITLKGRYYFVKDVKNREPVDRVIYLPEQTELTFYSSILNQKGETLTHKWYFDGKNVFNKTFKVNGNRWRVWTTKKIWDKNAIVTVEVVNSKNEVLIRKSIRQKPNKS